MTKQDIIREVFIKYLYDDEYTIDLALRDLSDLGVVIKVDRELPEIPINKDLLEEIGVFFEESGYTAWESLIEGEDASKAVKDFSKGSTGN